MKALILGGGFAGCSLAYFLGKKNWDVILLEKHKLGGLCRTYMYGGHPYEHGPHIFMSKKDPDDPITKTFIEITDWQFRHVRRKLFSYVEADRQMYSYPINYYDIEDMPDGAQIMGELCEVREDNLRLKSNGSYPQRGKDTSFEEYYVSRIGKTLYDKFMKNYQAKMWGISGNQMPTDTTFADQFRDKNLGKSVKEHDPIHWSDTLLGEDTFCAYPIGGFNNIFDRMTTKADVRYEEVRHVDSSVITTSNGRYYYQNFDKIFNTLAPDVITTGAKILRAMGRMMIPLVIPVETGLHRDYQAETVYYPGKEFQTRTTDMDTVTGYEANDRLILIEIPVEMEAAVALPDPMLSYAKEHNLFCDRAYPDRRSSTLGLLRGFYDMFPKNIIHCGRMATWQYQGMSEVMEDAYNIVEDL